MATRCKRAAIGPERRGVSPRRRASFPFYVLAAVGSCSGVAHAHHVSVSAEVPHWNLLLWIAIGLLVALEAAFILAARKRLEARRLEQAWMMMPLTVLLVLGVVRVSPAFRAPVEVADPGPDPFRVDVTAREWTWEFESPAQKLATRGEVHVPAGRVVTFTLTSKDVLHSFDIPLLGIHRDVLPGRPSTINLRLTRPGRYPLFCGALCGTGAQEMAGVIAVDPSDEYTVWVANQQNSAVKR